MINAEYALGRQITRRHLLEFAAVATGALTLRNTPPIMDLPFFSQKKIRPQILGTTFSQLQCSEGYLNLDYQDTFKQICDLGIDIVRLPTYWNEIESAVGFTKTDWLMEEAARRKLSVILTVGAKAPRYPELHLPPAVEQNLQTTNSTGQQIGSDSQTAKKILEHTLKVVRRYKDFPNLKYWQIENEPLDQLDFADNHSIAETLFTKEIDLVRANKTTAQKILLSNAFNIPSAKNSFSKSIQLRPDGSGFNIYSKVPRKGGGYNELTRGNYRDLGGLAEILKQAEIDPWIFETQAEPWENGKHVHFGNESYPSSSPQQTLRLVSELTSRGYDKQLLWGCEFWIKQKQLGFPQWVDAMRTLYSQSA